MIDGKKRTEKQWRDYRKKMEAKQEIRKERSMAGLCDKCMKGAFSLKCVERDLVRVCKNCGEEKIV